MGGGGSSEVLPLKTKRGGGFLAIIKVGGGAQQVLGVVLTQVLEVLTILEGHKRVSP